MNAKKAMRYNGGDVSGNRVKSQIEPFNSVVGKYCVIAIIAILWLCFTFTGAASADEWQEITPTGYVPDARFGHSMVELNDKIYVFGGQIGVRSELLNDLSMFDPGKNDWAAQQPSNDPPPARVGHGAVEYNGQMYVFFGEGDAGDLSDVWVYDPASKRWEQKVSGSPAPARVDHSVVVVGGKILVFGGRSSSGQIYEDLWCYDPSTDNWEQKESVFQNYGRFGQSVLPCDEMMYVFAGEGQEVYNNMLVYNLDMDSWSVFTPQGDLPVARSLHVSASEGYIWWIVGGEGSCLNDTWEFDVSTNAWTKKSDMPVALSQAAGVSFESQSQHVLLFGGLQSDGKPSNRTFVYIPDAEECVPGIEVNKTVFNETAGEWVDAITAEPNETVRFRCVVHNNGTCCDLTNITVTDILSDSLEYRNNATVDGVAQEPTAVSESEYKWEFAGPLAPCEAITIEFDARVIECGNDRNTQNATAWCEESGTWVSDEDTVWVNCTVVPPVCVETATGSGIACFETDAGTIESLVAINESTLPEEGKPDLNFPHGFFSFNIIGLTPGQTVVVTITLPDNVPVGTEYWKYHASEGGWIRIPMGSDDGDKVITITLVDGGLGDDDGTANGVIVDQGGPGIPKALPVITSFAPPSPVNDTVCNWRTFNITVNQTVNVSWYLNNTLQHTNVSTKEASYTLHAEVVGEHNVSAIASNGNGTDMQSWVWNVTAAPLPVLEINKTGVPDPVSPGGTLNYTIAVNNTGNETATNVTVKETYDGNVTFVMAVPAPSPGNDTWKFTSLNASETRWINISVIVNASVPNGTVLHNIVNVSCDEGVTDTDTADTTVLFKDLNCTCGDICVNETGWWRNDSAFNPSNTPIQHAIDNATAGETICVKDGTYTENVDVNVNNLIIKSENGSANCIVNASNPGDYVFEVTVNYVNISGFTIEGATGAGGYYYAGIYLGDNIVIAQYPVVSNFISPQNSEGFI